MSLRELIVRQLVEIGSPIDRLSIQFTRPVFPGQSLRLVTARGRFELAHSTGELAALGHASE